MTLWFVNVWILKSVGEAGGDAIVRSVDWPGGEDSDTLIDMVVA